MSDRQEPESRDQYRHFVTITTRWMDNDIYGHINNVQYYSYFDTAVNRFLIDQAVLDIHAGEVIGFVVETHCNYFSAASFPQDIEAGIRVAHIGRSSVRYEVGLFVDRLPGPSEVVPIPPAVWLFASAVIALSWVARRGERLPAGNAGAAVTSVKGCLFVKTIFRLALACGLLAQLAVTAHASTVVPAGTQIGLQDPVFQLSDTTNDGVCLVKSPGRIRTPQGFFDDPTQGKIRFSAAER